MFSFFIGLGIALFIAVAGFGGFLFKLSNANQADVKSGKFELPENAKPQAPETITPLSEMEAEETLNEFNEPPQKPNFNTGVY